MTLRAKKIVPGKMFHVEIDCGIMRAMHPCLRDHSFFFRGGGSQKKTGLKGGGGSEKNKGKGGGCR